MTGLSAFGGGHARATCRRDEPRRFKPRPAAWAAGVGAWRVAACRRRHPTVAPPFHCSTGTCTYEDGAVYTGDWKSDKRQGWGAHHFRTGERYEGEWADDKMHGA